MDKGILAVSTSISLLLVAGALVFLLVMQGIDEGCLAGIEEFEQICGDVFGRDTPEPDSPIATRVPRSGA